MVKKKGKESKLDKALERLVDKSATWPLLSEEQMYKFCDSIRNNAANNIEGNVLIYFQECSMQCSLKQHHWLTDEAVVMIHRISADLPVWFQSDRGKYLDAYAYIGKDDPKTDSKPRAFWECKFEETERRHYTELGSFYAAAIANEHFVTNKEYDMTKDYALLTWFTNGEMFELNLSKAADVDTVKAFISDMGVIINDKSSSTSSNDNKKDMPREEEFIKLLSEIAPEVIAAFHLSSEKDNNTPSSSKKDNANRKKALKGIAKKNDTPPPPNREDNEQDATPVDTE